MASKRTRHPRRSRRSWRPGRRIATAAIGVAALGAMAGCVDIPESSSVHEGRQIGGQDEVQHVLNNPAGPTPDASPQEIVDGFYDAMRAFPQTADTAREFLTTAAASEWDPSAGVVIYEDQRPGEGSTVVTDNTVVTDTYTQVGRLDVRGAWQAVAPEDAATTWRAALTKVDGQWRIKNPQQGTYIDKTYFTDNYQTFSLYFFDPSQSILAPYPVYLVDDDTAPTALVRDLLIGAPPQLRSAVTTAASRETTVDVAVSTAPNGLAEVPLKDLLPMSTDNLKLFAAQLAWTLRQLPEIDDISISVDGVNLDIPNFGSDFNVDEFQGYDPAGFSADRRLFALNPDGLVSVTADGVSTVLPYTTATRNARSVRVNPSGSLAAFVTANGSSIAVGDLAAQAEPSAEIWYDAGDGLQRPSWDVHNVLWLVDQGGTRLTVATKTRSREVAIPDLGTGRITSYAVSRDGVRFAAIVQDGDSARVEVWIVSRAATHPLMLKLIAPHVIPSDPPVRSLQSLSWVSPISMVLLGRESGGSLQPYEVRLDGSSTLQMGQYLQDTPRGLAGAPNVDLPLAVSVGRGRVKLETTDQLWVDIGTAKPVRSLGYGG